MEAVRPDLFQYVSLVDQSGTPASGGKVDTNNSTATLLNNNEIYTGASTDVLSESIITVSVFSSTNSITDGLKIFFSPDNVTFYESDVFTIPANTLKVFSFQIVARYFKVEFHNSNAVQTTFFIQTILSKNYSKPSSHRIVDNISSQDDAELVKAVLTGESPFAQFINVRASKSGSLNVALNEYQGDAFGRLRVSEPYTIFDNSLTTASSDNLFWSNKINGTSTGTYVRENAEFAMTAPAINDYIIRSTKQRFKYQPGKSHEVLITGLVSTQTGIRKRVGLFDFDNYDLPTINTTPRNGIFFENNSGLLSWNICKNGVVTETVIQASWNNDKCDGTGNSLFVLDLASTNIFFTDLEWLGVGAVRVGFVSGSGEIVVCHIFKHASNGFNSVYMRTANLPVSYSIENLAGINGTMTAICSSVISEGGFNPKGLFRAFETPDVGQAVSSGVLETLIGIRLKADHFEYTVEIDNVSILNTGNANAKWYLLFNPIVTGTPTWVNETNSSLQYTQSNLPVTNKGLILAAGAYSNDLNATSQAITTALRLGKSLAGVVDEIWLAVYPLANDTFHGSINLRESF